MSEAAAPSDRRESWRLLPYHVGPSDLHFARSDALARRCHVPTVWAHSTDRPTLILGAAQREQGIDTEIVRARSIRLVRRQAGGTSVYAGPGVLGLDVALPVGHRLALSDVVEAYRWIGEVWAQTMQSLGVPARTVSIAEARDARPGDSAVELAVRMACFGTLSPYEVVVDGKKLVGLSQVRRRDCVLWQSGVHRHFDREGLAAILASDHLDRVRDELGCHALGLDEILAVPPDLPTIIRAFLDTLSDILTVKLQPGDWTEAELQYAASAGS
jgi:lipoate-protein ligase A